MNLNIKTTNITLSPAVKEYFEKKLMMLDKIIDFNSDNVFIQAELGRTTSHHKQGEIFRAEINLRISGNRFRVVSEKEDLYSAIDMAKDELAREVKSGKEKRTSLIRRGAQRLKKILRFGKDDVFNQEG